MQIAKMEHDGKALRETLEVFMESADAQLCSLCDWARVNPFGNSMSPAQRRLSSQAHRDVSAARIQMLGVGSVHRDVSTRV